MSEALTRLPREERFRIYVEQRVEERIGEDPDFRARISGIEEIFKKLLFWSGLRRRAVRSRQEIVEETLEEARKEAAQQGMSGWQISRAVLYGTQIAKAFYYWDLEQQREASRSHTRIRPE